MTRFVILDLLAQHSASRWFVHAQSDWINSGCLSFLAFWQWILQEGWVDICWWETWSRWSLLTAEVDIVVDKLKTRHHNGQSWTLACSLIRSSRTVSSLRSGISLNFTSKKLLSHTLIQTEWQDWDRFWRSDAVRAVLIADLRPWHLNDHCRLLRQRVSTILMIFWARLRPYWRSESRSRHLR